MRAKTFAVDDRIVVITGAAGQLGSSYCSLFLQYGARVVAIDNHAEKLAALRESLDEGSQRRFLAVVADITRAQDLELALVASRDRFGTPNVLVNNAGIDTPPNSTASDWRFETFPEGVLARAFDVNVKGTILCCQVFGSAMAAAGRGSIINIASIYGRVSPQHSIYKDIGDGTFIKPVSYSVSKSALYGLTTYLAGYWGAKGVRVNVVTLGGVVAMQDPKFVAEYAARTALGRMAQPEEHGALVVFLASEGSSYITGADLVCDGGWLSY